MKSEQGFFQNNFSFLGFQIISIFDWILGLYVRERFVSINGVYNCSSKFDVPAHFGNGNHSFWLLSKIHYPQLIAFDFSNYISFLDIVLLSAFVLKSWKCNKKFAKCWNYRLTCYHCLDTNLCGNKDILLCFCHCFNVVGNKLVFFICSVNRSHVF